MRILGNILWHFPFLGFVTAFFTFCLGGILTLLVIPSPLGLGLLQYAKFLLLPFSYEMISSDDLKKTDFPLWKAYGFLIMLLYLPIGVMIAFTTAIQAILYCVTIIGIPVGLVLIKSLGTLLNPVGKICVPVSVAKVIQVKKEQEEVEKFFRSK